MEEEFVVAKSNMPDNPFVPSHSK